MRGKIRELLLGRAGLLVEARELADAAGGTAEAAAEIGALAREGCVIETDGGGGARLLSSPDLLRPAEMAATLAGLRVPFRMEHVRSAASTNDAAWELAEAGAPDGVVVCADAQLSGRGRGGSGWHSAPYRGLWFSALLGSGLPFENAAMTTSAAAVAVSESLRDAAGVEAVIKWPNDVWIGMKKVCGILAETRSRGKGGRRVVLGVGINVNQEAAEFPPEIRGTATSLRIETGRAFDRTSVLARVLSKLHEWHAALLAGRAQLLEERYSGLSMLMGREITFEFGKETVAGTVFCISCSEGLTLAVHGRGTRTFRAEHISSVEIKGR